MAGKAVPALLALLMAVPAGAEIYRWRDAAGTVHYGDHPPAARAAEPVRGALARRNVVRAVEPAPAAPAPVERRAPAPDPREDHCRELAEELDAVQGQLRAGYTPAEGERLRDRERSLRRARVRRC